ncbi:DUF1187 family protein [Klebsiella pneumoniae]|uniref:DUF1187 family protein n=1 Tax=Klebsiella pneumoniae TaxID=573 RepID=UPI003AF1527D
MFKITATIIKAGGAPAEWIRFSKHKMTREQCEKCYSGTKRLVNLMEIKSGSKISAVRRLNRFTYVKNGIFC